MPSHKLTCPEDAFWQNEKLRRRLQLVEDMARRDPVWAEKIAKRHAEFNAKHSAQQQEDAARLQAIQDAVTNAMAAFRADVADGPWDSSATAPTSSPRAPAVPLVTCTPAFVGTASVTSEKAMSIQTAAEGDSISAAVGVVSICNDSELALTAPITCSTECPEGDKGATGASTAPSATMTGVPSACVVHEGGIHFIASCLQPRDKPACTLSSSMVTPTTSQVLHSISLMDSSGSDALLSLLAPLDNPKGAETAVMHEDEQLLTYLSVERPLAFIDARDVVGDRSFFSNNVDTAEHTEIRLPPWPPPCTQLKLWATKISWPHALPNRSTGIQNIPQFDCQDMLFSPWTTLFPLHVESLEHTRSRIGIHLCCFCSQEAELLVFCFASCRIRYLHGTLDNIHLSADWQILKTVGPKWSAIWYDLREVRHQFAGIIVVKLKPPWPPSLGMCINLPTGDAVSGCHSCAIVIVGLAPIYLQLEQLTMVKFAAMMYMLAYAATLHHQFSSGHILLFSPAAPKSVMDFYFFPGLGMVVVFIPGLEQEQLTARLQFVHATRYDSECFAWEIAWVLVVTSCASSECGRSGHVTSKPAKPHGSNGICEIFMDLHSRLDLILLGVWVVWTHLTPVQIIHLHYSKELNSWEYPSPSTYQVMLKRHNIQCPFELIHWLFWKILSLVPTVARIASNHSDNIVLLGSVIGEGASIFPYCGRLHEKQLCWLPWQYVSYKESLSESFPWLHPLLGSWFQTLPIGNGFLYGFGPEHFQQVIAWSIYLDYIVIDNKLRLAVPWDPGLGWNVTARGIFLDQDPVSHGYYPGLAIYFNKVYTDHNCYIDFVQVRLGHGYDLDIFLEQINVISSINLIQVYLDYDTRRDLWEVKQHQVPWDHGGLTWHRLGVKPKTKEGGMLRTLLLYSWAGPWPPFVGLACSRFPVSRYKYMDRATGHFGLDWMASASSAWRRLPRFFLLCSSSSPLL